MPRRGRYLVGRYTQAVGIPGYTQGGRYRKGVGIPWMDRYTYPPVTDSGGHQSGQYAP